MWTIVLVLIFASALLIRCGAQTNVTSNSASERDSMIMCVSEFDKIFGLADTVCEDEDGEMAINSFESYMSNDTIDTEVARSLYQSVAKEIELVISWQIDDNYDAVCFDRRWHEFNKRYINLK